MNMDINVTTLLGRLVRDPELRQSPSGVMVANFTVAAKYRYLKDGEQRNDVAYVLCALFGTPATWAGEHHTDEPVAVSGHLVSDSRQKDGQTLCLRVKDVVFFHRANGANGQVQVPAAKAEDQFPF